MNKPQSIFVIQYKQELTRCECCGRTNMTMQFLKYMVDWCDESPDYDIFCLMDDKISFIECLKKYKKYDIDRIPKLLKDGYNYAIITLNDEFMLNELRNDKDIEILQEVI